MKMLSFYLAKRYLTAKWSLMSTLSILMISFGIITLITVISIMNGFHTNFRRKILETNTYHIIIQNNNYRNNTNQYIKSILSKNKEIISIIPYYDGEGIIKSSWSTMGIVIKALPKDVLELDNGFKREIKLPFGKFDLTKSYNIILGEELAKEIGVSVGDKVSILTFKGENLDLSAPSIRLMNIVGLFKTGYWDYDRSMVYISLDAAHKIFGISSNDLALGIKIKNIFKVNKVAKWIRNKLNKNIYLRTWIDMNRPLFEALKNEKIAIGFVVFLIIISGAFNIIGSLIMTIMEKKKEIGILRAIGATPSLIKKIFVIDGLYIGILGTLIGVSTGLFITIHIEKIFHLFEIIVNFFKDIIYNLFLSPLGFMPVPDIILLSKSIYYIEGVPVEIHLLDIIVISVMAVGISVLAAYYPASRAANLKPVDAIRYE